MIHSEIALKLIGRSENIFDRDLREHEEELRSVVRESRVMVVGGAGTIGQATVRELFKWDPRALHVVDMSENNLVELVRDLRSSVGYGSGDFKTFAIDAASAEFEACLSGEGPYDIIVNLSALKHVRSERDPYTLMRLVFTNVVNVDRMLEQGTRHGAKRHFSVSTDKAANPANLMGATKRLMEQCMLIRSDECSVGSARFANVAFSDGSLLHGFSQRLAKGQPLAAPSDVQRYFITDDEAGRLCVLAAFVGQNREIFYPLPTASLTLMSFSEIAKRYLELRGIEAVACSTEEEARRVAELSPEGKWPCYFFESDTTGEKAVEEFRTTRETVDTERFKEIGVIRTTPILGRAVVSEFLQSVEHLRSSGQWTREDLKRLIVGAVPELDHRETGKFLDDRM